MALIAPSILNADFSRLGEQVVETVRAGADRIHIDVMDGHFVPNLSMGPIVVKGLRPVVAVPLEVHLMVTDPAMFIEPFFRAGADSVIVHQEVVPEPMPLIEKVHAAGKKIGLAVKPDTPVEVLEPFLKHIYLALCMTVQPGFGGQSFLPESPARIRKLRELINKHNPNCELEVDGGIDKETARTAIEAGANVLVVGTGIFGDPAGPAEAVQALRSIASC
ncbi:MAG: ribulose-phosphate 3-epimerase [Gemmatales bacterium]|nr:MAG: ribulose-phosphate 3-epimerase [Gemmatales bacterium]